MKLDSILIAGCGNMGGAMLAGWLAGGLDPARFTVVDPLLEAAPDGVALLREVPRHASPGAFDAVLLGVKPQGLDAIVPALAPSVGADTLLMSILAGVEFDSLCARFPDAGAILRIMPNLAARIGRSPIALDARGLDEAARDLVTAFMEPLGTVEWLAGEELFDAVTALSGCGPAFVYRFIESLAAGAVSLGIDPVQAQRLAVTMVEGAAQLAGASELSPGELADRVASPGGSTRAGMDVLDEGGALAKVVAAAMTASRDRNAEMAAEARASNA